MAYSNIVFFGSASSPSDGGSQTTMTPTVTPPSNMRPGDLVLMVIATRDYAGSLPILVTTSGGQTWNSLNYNTGGTNVQSQMFWCRFNGTWSADPVVTHDDNSLIPTSLVMLVFRPTSIIQEWATYGSEYQGALSVGAGSPSSVQVTGHAIDVSIEGVSVVTCVSEDDNTWGDVQGVLWKPLTPVGSAQFRNTAGSDLSLHFAYLRTAETWAETQLDTYQLTLGPDAGSFAFQTFSETEIANHKTVDILGNVSILGATTIL